MQQLSRTVNNVILFILFLLLFLLVFENRMLLPVWLQVVGRLHPMVLHIPIGAVVFSFVILFFRRQFRKKQVYQLILLSLLFISLSASVTALVGFFLSVNGNYGTDAMLQHKVSGVLFSFMSYGLLLWFRFGNDDLRIFYGLGMVVFIALLIAGHTGSILTHGENYILAPLMKSTAAKDPEIQSVYELAVRPVLEGKCFSCHNESKAKGKLIMTSAEKFRQGGKSGPAWVDGEPDSSRMIRYIHLPLEHDDHMPPDGKPQLSSFEISLLESWIRSGADFQRKFADYPVSDTLVTLTQIVLGAQQKGVSNVSYDFKPVAPDVLEKLNTPFCSVTQLYQNSPALQADFFVREFYQAESLQKLKAAKDQLVSLNLSKMPISDNDLTVVVEFKNLEKLNLNFTAVTGNGIKQLTTLSKLKSLAISGTAVTAESVRLLAGNSALTEVFVWNTPITAAEVAALSKDFPKIHFVHRLFTDNNILALGKPQLLNDGVLKQGETLVLRHSMPGVTIRYTLDDSAPDSLSGLTYKDPLMLIETVTLKAIACKDGWYCSNLLEAAVFVEGIQPDRVALLTPPDKQYPGEGAASLTDRQKGLPDFFREPSWLGYRENHMEVLVEFADTPELSKIVLSYADNLGAYVFPPAAVELWGGSSEMNLKRIQAMTYEMPKSYRPNSMAALEIPFTPAAYSHYKIIVRPVSRLPEWHGGKGQKGWFFVDEVFFYN